MTRLESLGLFRRSPSARSSAEIEADIDDEIEFHLAMREREHAEAGLAPEAARAAALARFGDARRVRAACRRIQMGERTMLQRWNAAATAILLALAVYLGWQLASTRAETAELVGSLRAEIGALADAVRARDASPADGEAAASGAARELGAADARVALGADERAEGEQPVDAAAWLARFREDQSWGEVVAIGEQIAALAPERALEVMRAIYRDLPTAFARQQILKAFVFDGGHPAAVEVLHLAATDPELAVQGWAYGYLESYAFQDFSADHQAYLDWYARFGGLPVAEVLERNARELAARLATAAPGELAHELRAIDGLDLRAGAKAGIELDRVLREAGILSTLRSALRASDDETREHALAWMRELRPDEAFLRAEVLPLLDPSESRDDALASAACRALGTRGNAFAVEPLVASLARAPQGAHGRVYAHAMALAEIGDARAIPALIALLDSATTEEEVYGLGYFGLKDLTGVSYDPSHDGAFWRRWWTENRHRLPAEARELDIPTLAFQR